MRDASNSSDLEKNLIKFYQLAVSEFGVKAPNDLIALAYQVLDLPTDKLSIKYLRAPINAAELDVAA